MNKNQKQKQQGFTLVELLVVLAIIGLLAGLISIAVGQARAKGRDAKRKGDLAQLQTALEIYFNTYGTYPIACNNFGNCDPNADNWGWFGISDSTHPSYRNLTGPQGWIPNLAPEFVSALPRDPKNSTSNYSGYLYKSNGTNYKILLHDIGPESFPEIGQPYYDPRRPITSWMVTNNPAATASNCAPLNAVTCW